MGRRVEWKRPQYFTVLELPCHPIYAGACVFGRTGQRTQVIDGRARKSNRHTRPLPSWSVSIREHHPEYISWAEFEKNQQMIAENAHMKKRMARKSARGGHRSTRHRGDARSRRAHRLARRGSPNSVVARAGSALEYVCRARCGARGARTKTGRHPEGLRPAPVGVLRALAGRWCDRNLAVTMNRMRCPSSDGQPWTTLRVRKLRERLGIAAFDLGKNPRNTIGVGETAERLRICIGSVHRLIRAGILPATQAMKSAPWEVPLAALNTEAVRIGVRDIVARRPRNFAVLQDVETLKLPGI